MNAHSPLPVETDAESPERSSRAALERQLALLGELAEIGMQVARAVGRQAQEPQDPAALDQIAKAYARVSRAVRLTLALQSKVIKDLQAYDEAHEDENPVLREPAYRRKFRVERIVERLIKAEHDDEDAIDRLAIEAGERLDDEDLYGEILDKPLGELVALICKDLGLNPDWAKLAEEHWAKAEIASGVKGSPFSPLPLEGGEVGSGGECRTLKRKTPEAGSPPEFQSSISARTPPSPPFPPGGGRESEGFRPPDRFP